VGASGSTTTFDDNSSTGKRKRKDEDDNVAFRYDGVKGEHVRAGRASHHRDGQKGRRKLRLHESNSVVVDAFSCFSSTMFRRFSLLTVSTPGQGFCWRSELLAVKGGTASGAAAVS
jgi:hypothetical protein